MSEQVKHSNRSILKTGGLVVAAAFMFGFAMVPLYRVVCEHVLGIKLKQGSVSVASMAGMAEDTSRTVNVQFVSNVNSKLPWEFTSELASIDVHPGRLTEVWFDATNNSDIAIVGNAVPSVAPGSASLYFNKTECFCFTEQVLQAGESRRMPVRFFIDPQLPARVNQLTLSYTFYANDAATLRLSDTGSPLASAN